MSTQVNLGASYLVNDYYRRFIDTDASERKLVWVARLFTIISIGLGAGLGLMLTNAGQAFSLLLLLGAGTGLIYILRWFWWRINAYTEIVAMVSSLIIAVYFNFIHDSLGVLPLESWQKIVIGALLTTAVWIIATFLTPPDDEETLKYFVKKVNPGGPGWSSYSQYVDASDTKPWPVPRGILMMVLGCIAVYSLLLGTGFWLYGQAGMGVLLTVVFGVSVVLLLRLWSPTKPTFPSKPTRR
jgi:hypothetical protein